MTRVPSTGFEPHVADWLEDGPRRAPAAVLETVLTAFPLIPQRRAPRVPWRYAPMNAFARLAVAAVAVIAVGALGLNMLQRDGPPTAGNPSVSSPPTPSASPPPTPSSTQLPALTETYTSSIHGISIAYPSGWMRRQATEVWTSGVVTQESLFADVLYQRHGDSPFIALTSRALAERAPNQWVAAYLALMSKQAKPCTVEPVTVDGATGSLLSGCLGGPAALVVEQDRGYLIWLYRVDDLAWFREILATVQLDPAAAAGTTASTIPPMTDRYTSTDGHASFSYPSGWYVRNAGVAWDDDLDPRTALAAEFTVASEGIPAGQTAQQWIGDQASGNVSGPCPAAASPPEIAVGTGSGSLLVSGCPIFGGQNHYSAVAVAGDRGYTFRMDTTLLGQAWFEALLATVVLDP